MARALGLLQAEADARLARFGRNELPKPRRRGLGAILLETLREPMFLLLLGAAALYLTLGDLGEGLFLLVGACGAVGLVIFQEARSERALAALRDLSQPHVRILRDGQAQRRPAAEIVPGDAILVGEGERLPADGALVAGEILSVDESALTGESAPVLKPVGAGSASTVFAGTLVTSGQGVVEVTRTGAESALGRIGASLASVEQQRTPLQAAAARIVGVLGAAAVAFCVVVALAYGLAWDDWTAGALAGITVAIALVPEEIPMVLSVFLALGAWRLAAHKVLVRRAAVVEALGSATMLCVDKTGTLTANRMELVQLWTPEAGETRPGDQPADAAARELVRTAGLACALHPTDPMDRAVRRLEARWSVAVDGAPARVWPLVARRLAVIQLWNTRDGVVLAAKGAPEAVFRLCGLPEAERGRLLAVVHAMAGEGLRVLAVAVARPPGQAPDAPEAASFRLVGLLGFEDPVRPEVVPALDETRRAGVGVMMITGDHPATALAVARSAGIDVAPGVLTGDEIEALPFPTLCERLRRLRVCARVLPHQKLLIVEALKRDGHVVVMTGDGVNDAPALEAADIGVAMGEKGADVAREAADLVLLDDSFGSLVGGIRLGRRIFTNLRRALTYVTAIHVPVAGVALAPVLLGMPPLLLPMHVVLLELVIDPVCALVFEGEPSEADAMRRPPRPPDEPLFGAREALAALLQGLVLLAAVLGLYAWALRDHPAPEARGAAFATLAAGNLVLALADSMSRSAGLFVRQRAAYWIITAAAAVLLTLVFAWPPLSRIFQISFAPGLTVLAAILALVAGGWPVLARNRWTATQAVSARAGSC